MKFRLIESDENGVSLVRGESDYNHSNTHKNLGGLFFEPESAYADIPIDKRYSEYGKLNYYRLDSNADIFTSDSPINFVRSEVKQPTDEQLGVIYDMLQNSFNMDELGTIDFDVIDTVIRNEDEPTWFAIYQYIARSILEPKGYDGAHWEDDPYDVLTPDEYQIWHLDKVSKVDK